LISGLPVLSREMGERAHATVKERFEKETQIEHLELFYEEAISRNGAAEQVGSRRLARMAPQFAQGLPAK